MHWGIPKFMGGGQGGSLGPEGGGFWGELSGSQGGVPEPWGGGSWALRVPTGSGGGESCP